MPDRIADPQFARMMAGYGATSAEILYRLPDHPAFLQTFLWQFEDFAPHYPRLKRFLEHWEREVEAIIHSVRIMHRGLIAPHEIRTVTEAGVLQ